MPKGEKDKPYYPHLLPEETIVWRRFLEKHEEDFDRFEYDVHVGVGAIPPDKQTDRYRKDFATLTQKRIDALGYVGSKAVIIEIRPLGAYHLAGKLEGYQYFYSQLRPEEEPAALLFVCEYMNDEDRAFFKSRDIEVIVV